MPDKLLKFPSDNKLREKYFSDVEKSHPAKANLYMMIWLIKKLTKPGETILDPTSGAGSLMYATLMGRNVVSIELEKLFQDCQELSWAKMSYEQHPVGTFTLCKGDARRFLPYPGVHHCIFSPPYSVNISKGGNKLIALAAESGTQVAEYGKDRAQLATLGYFNLLIAMKEVYRGIYNSLPPGGFMASITKDSVDTKAASFRGYGGQVPYTADNIKACYEVGFELYQLWAREAKPSLRLQIAWSQNPDIPHVTTEEIIIMRRPK
jgi:hypothetical protein